MRRLLSEEASEVLFHHRFPTSTANVQTACHPFSTKGDLFGDTQYVLVHNGVLSNDYQLSEQHEKLGIRYVSEQDNYVFNDSEALLYDVALTLSGQQSEMKAKGSIAFICVELQQGKRVKLHFARNDGNPLHLNYRAGKVLTIASEGKGTNIPTDTLYTYDYKTGELSSRYFYVPTSYRYTNMGFHLQDTKKQWWEQEAEEYSFIKTHPEWFGNHVIPSRTDTEVELTDEVVELEKAQVNAYVESVLRDMPHTSSALNSVEEELKGIRANIGEDQNLLMEADINGDIDVFEMLEDELMWLYDQENIIELAILKLKERLYNEIFTDAKRQLPSPSTITEGSPIEVHTVREMVEGHTVKP